MEKHVSDMASHQTIADAGGKKIRFFCDLSGLAVYTSEPIHTDTEKVLRSVWQEEAMCRFNRCHKCGKWVCDMMYNPDVLNCVSCAPWEESPSYCLRCGTKILTGDSFCRACGTKLRYGEVEECDDSSA